MGFVTADDKGAIAVFLPFTTFVAGFGETWRSVVPEDTVEEDLARQFVGRLLRRRFLRNVVVGHRIGGRFEFKFRLDFRGFDGRRGGSRRASSGRLWKPV